MVIASNEWLNNYEDEQKSASVNTTSTTTNTNNTPATSSTTGSTATVNTINTVSTATTSTTAATSTSTITSSTSTTPRTESEEIPSTPTADNNISNPNTDFQQTEHQEQPQQQQQQQSHSMINNKLQMMDESLKIDQETNEIENNNKESASSTSKNNSPSSQSNSNTSLQTIVGNSTTNLTTNINSNTSNIAIANQQNTTNISSPIFNPNPITQQALSSALQSALNATSNNVTVSVNLPNSFLTSLGSVGMSPNATLQHTTNLAKQYSATLCGPEPHSNLNNLKTKALDNNADLSMREYQQTTDNNGQAKIVLHCEPNSHPFQTRIILLTPNIECKVGRLIAKSKASESNAIFDCKVLSRNHAVLWYSNDGKFWVKDTNSSNGTFINESKLGTEPSELHFGDVVKFGVDVMENSRKEVHGCIIAGVKLYLPDGRETISIESSGNQLSPHSGEGRISFDELHRLNLYMQEASQREKVLKSKLFNIQNILDATRKNSALCWQSMIAEDQLLHRIHSLEKKLQLMEKNVPENVLRNEVLKLIDDKNLYQHSAKEALRKVYQERCDAMQMLSKMESAVTASDNECKILRDQIMNTKQSLQDVNSRLLSLETEYNEFKGQNDRQQQEAREQSDLQAADLTDKLQQRESECELLKRKISELLLKRADLLDEEQLQKQAIEKLDAAIADMDLGDDDEDEEDDDDDDDDDENDNEHNDKLQHEAAKAEAASEMNKALAINGKSAKDAQSQSSSDEEKTNSTKLSEEQQDGTKRTGGQKSTILKWLENSDLNKKEGSLDIFDAICNESDSSDDSDNGAGTNEAKNNNKLSNTTDKNKVENFEMQYLNFNNKLQSVQQNLTKLEAEIASKSKETSNDITTTLGSISSTVIVEEEEEEEDESDDENDDESEISAEDDQRNEIISKRNVKKSVALLQAKDNKSYTLLKNSVIMLREAYNDICLNMQQQKASQLTKPAISVQTQFQKYAQHKVSKSASKRVLAAQATLKPTSDSEENDDDIAASVDDNDDVVSGGGGTVRLSAASLQTIEEVATARDATLQLEQNADKSCSNNREKQQQQQLEAAIKLYQKQIEDLQAKLDLNENDAQNTLEIMQMECDAFKDKVEELTKIVETLNDEKEALQQVINENKSNAQKTAECCKHKLDVITEQLPVPQEKHLENVHQNEPPEFLAANEVDIASTPANDTKANSFELEMREELAAINNTSVQREEELIMYKERLEQTQSDNLRLRNEIADLVLKSNDYTKTMLKRMAPYGAVVVAILVYFIITYF